MTDLTDVDVWIVGVPGREGDLRGGSATDKLADRIDELTAKVQAIAGRVRDRLTTEPQAPGSGWGLDEITMEFKVELEAGAGVLVARAGSTGGFAVTLRFSRPSANPGP
jgi:hypothetical protein